MIKALRTILNFSLFSLLLIGLFSLSGCAAKGGGRPLAWLEEAGFQADLARMGAQGGVTVVAPASGLAEADLKPAADLAARLGFNFPAGSLAPGLIPYHAHLDEARLEFLGQALQDPQTRVIWALRGGYGSGRLLEKLARSRLSRPKIFIGYSDLTFVHLFLNKAGWRTIHGPMVWEMNSPGKDKDNFRLLAGLLSGRLKELRYEGLKPFNEAARRLSRPIRASVTGGNLTCLAASLGTPWPLEADGQILLLEDVDEPGYKIDRLLTQLQAGGRLQKVRAVILGSFTGDDPNVEYALTRFAENFDRPVFRTDLFGHGPRNYPLIFNAPAVISPGGGEDSFSLSQRSVWP